MQSKAFCQRIWLNQAAEMAWLLARLGQPARAALGFARGNHRLIGWRADSRLAYWSEGHQAWPGLLRLAWYGLGFLTNLPG